MACVHEGFSDLNSVTRHNIWFGRAFNNIFGIVVCIVVNNTVVEYS